ncbi:hypothetical protein Rsub_06376 [Raphidocelis subcapitata]|uniref:F-box domain-containing protein n=1 Tax=Raphidocelis subcapitata TaxID=307507 RepID=A0A2V0P0E2_9CHLO|nr:hypothetical protein Rsub_06376 [Raphidocelis subcapitata]|eukprot:GBF93338.1 hypothetical protein Rsub_06376 [Raphidocelis subcapitata]
MLAQPAAPCCAWASRRTSQSGGDASPHSPDGVLCDGTLTAVLSWLGVPDLAGGAALVCRRWHQASACKEVWRSRMHPALLRLYSESPGGALTVGGALAAGGAPTAGGERYAPARLFKAVYCTNLLRNGEFLERTNSTRAPEAGGGRSVTWVPTHNVRGVSWEYPMLDASLPLPPPAATHLPGDGSPSPAAARTAAAPIDIRRPPARRGCCGSGSGSAGAGAGGSLGSSPAGSLGSSGGGGAGRSPTSSGPFAVGCVAPSCFMWSEVAQVIDLGEALQAQGGLPPELAAAALASGAQLEVSVWVAAAGGAGAGARRGGAAAAAPPPSECQVIAALVPLRDAEAAGAAAVPLEALAKAAVPLPDQLPSGLPQAEAQAAAAAAAAGELRRLGMPGTRLEVLGPFPATSEWRQVKCRLRLPPAPEPAAGSPGGALGAAPRLVVALRGRAGAFVTPARPIGRGPKFMAARAVLVPLDGE